MSSTLARVVTVLLFSAKQTTGERCDGRRKCVCVWARRDWAAAAVAFGRIRRYMYGDDDDDTLMMMMMMMEPRAWSMMDGGREPRERDADVFPSQAKSRCLPRIG